MRFFFHLSKTRMPFLLISANNLMHIIYCLSVSRNCSAVSTVRIGCPSFYLSTCKNHLVASSMHVVEVEAQALCPLFLSKY